MDKSNVVRIPTQACAVPESRRVLEEVLRQGAQRLLQAAIESEVTQFLEVHVGARTECDRQAVVRNGSLP